MKYTEYLEKYLQHFETQPASEIEISKVESEMNITFPVAFRNFLLLVGNDFNDLTGDAGWSELDASIVNMERFVKSMNYRNITFTEPIYVFSAYDSFFFIKLNTGDDPEVWAFDPQLYDENGWPDTWPEYLSLGYQLGFYKMKNTFSEYLYALINDRLLVKRINILPA